MSANVKVRCDVCFESYTLDLFRFLPACGHGLCIVCTEKTHEKRNCAICRHPKGFQEPVQIYLTFAVESTPADKARSVIDNLARIGPESIPMSVQKAGRKIRHVVRDVNLEEGVARELLEAAKNLDERVFPLFMELDLANDKVATLTAKVDNLRQQLKAADDQISQLRRALTESRGETWAALATAEKNKGVALTERAENARLSRAVQRQLTESSAKEEENTLLRSKLTRRDNRISLLERKLKVLSRTVKQPHPKPDANDPDESLQIDNSAEGIRIPRKSNDWLEPARIVRKPLRPGGGAFVKRAQTMPDIEL
ncbi:hypothetical protein B0H11DRAFT_2004453 [Mycena galericulata]|nr:hypothetical protein B0H11DRAFT_2004453 [Mycena galericulata]